MEIESADDPKREISEKFEEYHDINHAAAKHLFKLFNENRLTEEQKYELEDIVARALAYDGYADYECFNDIFRVEIDETNWKPVYINHIK